MRILNMLQYLSSPQSFEAGNRVSRVVAVATVCAVIQFISLQAHASGTTDTTSVNRETVAFSRGQSAYVVTTSSDAISARYVATFIDYVATVVGQPTIVVDLIEKVPAGHPAIEFRRGFQGLPATVTNRVSPKTDEDFAIGVVDRDGRKVVLASASQPNGIRRAVQKLVIDSQQTAGALELVVANNFYSPWIEQREFQPVTWSPTFVRGKFTNSAVDPRIDYHKYTDLQLEKYLAAFDWFG